MPAVCFQTHAPGRVPARNADPIATAISTYTITTSNSPTSFAATSLPGGVTLNTPTGPGSITSSLTASNTYGTSAPLSLVWTIASPTVTPAGTSIAVINGNVAIGATTPPAKLGIHVTSGANISDGLVVECADGASLIGFKLRSDAMGNFRGALTVKANGGSEIETMTLGADGYAGEIGIGTTTPGYPLSFGTALGNKLALYDVGAGYVFGIQDSVLQIFASTAADRVGIGTINLRRKLSVNGTIRAKEVIVDNTGWSDYVFEKGHRLAPLAEVEQHIAKNGHLPGIPSTAEVTAHGISVGEMQSLLLAKVEEITLHQIAQEKELARLREENQALRRPLQEISQR